MITDKAHDLGHIQRVTLDTKNGTQVKVRLLIYLCSKGSGKLLLSGHKPINI